jgi:hypothetical protein
MIRVVTALVVVSLLAAPAAQACLEDPAVVYRAEAYWWWHARPTPCPSPAISLTPLHEPDADTWGQADIAACRVWVNDAKITAGLPPRFRRAMACTVLAHELGHLLLGPDHDPEVGHLMSAKISWQETPRACYPLIPRERRVVIGARR